MRKPLFAFLFMMLVSFSLPAQSIKRFWSDGPLTAKDFVSQRLFFDSSFYNIDGWGFRLQFSNKME